MRQQIQAEDQENFAEVLEVEEDLLGSLVDAVGQLLKMVLIDFMMLCMANEFRTALLFMFSILTSHFLRTII